VAVPVDLDDEPFVGPEQVHLDEFVGCLNTGIDERGWEVGGLDVREDLVLEVALRARASVRVGFEGSLQDAEVSAWRAGHRGSGGLFAEAVAERGLVDHVGELVLGQDVGEVDEGAGHGGDRDAAVGREIARVEVAGPMSADAGYGSAATERDHVDAVDAAAPRGQVNGGSEVTESRSLAGPEHRGHPTRFLREARVADRVHAAVNAVQPAGVDTMGHRSARQPERGQLPDRDQPVLTPRDLRDQSVPGGGCVTLP
jgi:hypothetical protein